jgi:hypothetical protein
MFDAQPAFITAAECAEGQFFLFGASGCCAGTGERIGPSSVAIPIERNRARVDPAVRLEGPSASPPPTVFFIRAGVCRYLTHPPIIHGSLTIQYPSI